MGLIGAMNVTQHHPKVGLVLAVPKGPFISGDEVRGKFTLECRTENGLGLAAIGAELSAVQELASRDHAAATTFIHSRRLFQGPGLPISNAVLSESSPDDTTLPRSYHPARKGQTSFFFTFPLPPFAPSTINFGNGLAQIRYEVSIFVEVVWKGERRVVTAQKVIEVVECLPQLREVPPTVIVGENGKIHLQSRILGLYSVLGQTACVELYVTNHSTRKTNGVTLTLAKRLQLRQSGPQQDPFEVTDTIVSIPFNGPEYSVPPGGEGVAHLVFDVPKGAFGALVGQDEDDARLRQKGVNFLFSVQCEIYVTIGMGLGAQDIVFTLPMITAHPETLPAAPPPPLATPPLGPQTYAPDFPTEDYPPLEPPRPHYAQQHHYSAPPSPQWSPYQAQPMHSATPPFQTPPPPPPLASPPNPYFPPYSSQPTTPLQTYFPPLHSFAPPPLPSSPQLHHGQAIQQHWAPPPPVNQAAPSHGPFSYGSPPPQSPRQLPAIPAPQQAPPVHDVTPVLAPAPPPVTAPIAVYNNVSPHRQAEDAPEGKGHRAARVSQHLRYTSRNRSTSPTSHRYPVPVTAASLARRAIPAPISIPSASAPLPPHIPEPQSPSAAHPLSQSLGTLAVPQSPNAVDQYPTGLTQSPAVVSPRPRLSPRLSFGEGGTAGGLKVASIKSKPVEDLERMAEQVLKDEETGHNLGLDLGEPSREKTLPSLPSFPPTSSGRERLKSRPVGLPTAAEVFGSDAGSIRSFKVANPVPRGAVSAATIETGLDALERRLAGDRERAEKLDAAERWLNRGRAQAAPIPEPESPGRPRPRREPSGPRADITRKRSTSQASSRSNHSQSQKESGLPPMPMPRAIGASEHEKEVKRLQKEAVKRVGLWVGAVPDDDAAIADLIPWATLSGQAIPKTSSGFVSTRKPAGATQRRLPLTEMFAQGEMARNHTGHSSLTEESPLRAAAATAESPVMKSKKLDNWSMPPPPPPIGLGAPKLPSYDVKSARGGKGGVVTAVTAIWETGPGASSSTSAVPPIKRREAPVFKIPDLPASASQPVLSLSKPPKFTSPPKPGRAFQHPAAVPADPAVVNGTIAKPYLSSAASIVNPNLNPRPQPRLSVDRPPAIPESRSAPQLARTQSAEPLVPGVGQGRLKELIAKYQNTTSPR